MPLAVSCTNEEKIPVSVNPVTATGKPAALDGPLTLSVISGDSTIVSTGANSFEVVSSDTPGDTTFLVEGDADLGGGVVLIQDTVTLSVLGAMAASFGMTAGTPVPK